MAKQVRSRSLSGIPWKVTDFKFSVTLKHSLIVLHNCDRSMLLLATNIACVIIIIQSYAALHMFQALLQIVVLSKGKTLGKREDIHVTDQYLHTLYVTSLLRIAGALFLNACKRCSDTSGKI